MARRDEDSSNRSVVGVHERQTRAVEDRLSAAVAELRRLTRGQLFQALEGLADADADDILSIPGDGDAGVRRLRLWGAEHLRMAAELEAAARCCRLIEQELRQRIAAIRASSQARAQEQERAPELEQEQGGVSSATAEATGRARRLGLGGWLKMIPQRQRPAQQPTDKHAIAASPVVTQPLLVPSPSLSLPPVGKPEADITALMLGPLELDVAGRRVVRWSSLKARAMFQYLLLHRGRPVRRDVLMHLQWPHHTPTSARNNLNVALYSLRNTLDGPWREIQPVLYQDGCYVLNPLLSWWMDRDEFLSALSEAHMLRCSGAPPHAICHYQRAVQLYRGPLFEDDLSGDWYLAEQRHLNQLYLEALESLGEIYFDLGDLASAERFGQLALTKDPCSEPVYRLLMRCYASEHKLHLVTRQYHLCINALRDELGITPGAETLRLFRDLTDRD